MSGVQFVSVFVFGMSTGWVVAYFFLGWFFRSPVRARDLLRGLLDSEARKIVGCLVCGERGKLVVLEETALPDDVQR